MVCKDDHLLATKILSMLSELASNGLVAAIAIGDGKSPLHRHPLLETRATMRGRAYDKLNPSSILVPMPQKHPF